MRPNKQSNHKVYIFKFPFDSVYIGRTSQGFHLRRDQHITKPLRNCMANGDNKSYNCHHNCFSNLFIRNNTILLYSTIYENTNWHSRSEIPIVKILIKMLKKECYKKKVAEEPVKIITTTTKLDLNLLVLIFWRTLIKIQINFYVKKVESYGKKLKSKKKTYNVFC